MMNKTLTRFSALVLPAVMGIIVIAPSASLADSYHPGTTILVSKTQTGAPGEGGHPVISADGRYVAFESLVSLRPEDTDDWYDIYRTDTQTELTILVSVTVQGVAHSRDQFHPSMSADGQKIAYRSGIFDPNVPEPTGYSTYAILRDIGAGTSRRLSVTGGSAQNVRLSGDGRWAAVSMENEGSIRLDFVRTSDGAYMGGLAGPPGWDDSDPAPLSYDGKFVAYMAGYHVYRHDRDADGNEVFDEVGIGKTATVYASTLPNGSALSGLRPTISSDGQRVGFMGGNWLVSANNVGTGNAASGFGIYVRDIPAGTTKLASSSSFGVTGAGVIGARSSISADGRFIAFSSPDNYLAPGDFNPGWDVFLKEIDTGITRLVSTAPPDGKLNNDRMEPAVSADGRFIAFQSAQVIGTGSRRVWLRDRLGVCSTLCL